MCSKNHLCSHKLRLPQRVVAIGDPRLHQHGLRGVIDLRRNEAYPGLGQHLAIAIDHIDRHAHPELCRMFHRNIHVNFQTSRLVDRGQLRRGRHAVTHSYRNISHNSTSWSDDFVVMKLHFLLPHLSVERVHLRLCGIQSASCLVQVLLAHHARVIQASRALILLFRPDEISLLRRPRTLLTLDGSLLLPRINLH